MQIIPTIPAASALLGMIYFRSTPAGYLSLNDSPSSLAKLSYLAASSYTVYFLELALSLTSFYFNQDWILGYLSLFWLINLATVASIHAPSNVEAGSHMMQFVNLLLAGSTTAYIHQDLLMLILHASPHLLTNYEFMVAASQVLIAAFYALAIGFWSDVDEEHEDNVLCHL
jgi:hypothetical protein